MVVTCDKTEVVLHPWLMHLNNTIQDAIVKEATEQLGREVTWDDIEDYDITLIVELSLFQHDEQPN